MLQLTIKNLESFMQIKYVEFSSYYLFLNFNNKSVTRIGISICEWVRMPLPDS